MFNRRNMIIAAVALVTLANGGILGYALTSKKTSPSKNNLTEVLKKNTNIKNAELKTINATQKGKEIGTGEYAFQSFAQSKITTGDSAQLVVASEEKSNSHFVLALVGKDTKIPANKINSGWNITSIVKDRMWAPGACSSKPTFLLQGKYIFIDDGKTNPEDKYSSYIIFNMTSGQYNYFGGSSFTKEQGDHERILNKVNENDKLVFYIDPADSGGPLAGNPEGKHAQGSDHGYIIRREIDPATLKYTDYSLPFTVPPAINVYTITGGYSDASMSLTGDGSQIIYDGKVSDNQINLTQVNLSSGSAYIAPPLESELELKLNNPLTSALPNLDKQTPYANAPKYTTKFSVTELGENNTVKFLIATQRFGGYDTPAVYNESSGSVNPMTDAQVLQSYSNYVALGVF